MDAWLILGMLLFFGPHSLRLLADDVRTQAIARWGLWRWKGAYALVSALGLGLIVAAYPATRSADALWPLLPATRHLAGLLTLPAFILIVSAYVPGNRLQAVIGHPMVAGTALWALAHLLANGRPADLLLFGVTLGWAILCFIAGRRRDARSPPPRRPARTARDLLVFGAGLAGWAAFAFVAHGPLIGVPALR